jgi:hypothetical protein
MYALPRQADMFSVAFTLPLMILKLRRKHVWRDLRALQ